MKISCQTCQAKYTIADEKVLGKIVKIRCKKCGATIVINGNDSSSTAVAGAGDTGDNAAQGANTWSVSVSDGDQRTMTEAEVVAAFRSGVVTEETYCWADGMADWQALRDIATLALACGLAPSDAVEAPMSRGGTIDEVTTTTHVAPEAQAAYGGGGGLGVSAQESARRTGGRAAGADLFGGADRAGADDEVTTSAAPSMRTPPDDDGRLTGQRNENSVLFSLAALTNTSGPNPSPKVESKTSAIGDGSGLIDIRALSAAMTAKAEPKKESSIDDIMNLSGGGAFAPSLAAPVLGSPGSERDVVRAAAEAAPKVEEKKGRTLLISGGIGALVVAAAAGYFLFAGPKPPPAPTPGAPVPVAVTPPAAAPTPPPAAAAPAGETPPPSAAPAAPNDTPASPSPTKGTAPSKESKSGARPAAAPAPEAPAPVAETPKAPSAPPPVAGSLEDEIRKSAAKNAAAAAPPPAAAPAPKAAAPSGGGSDQPFNMGEARAQLGAILGGIQSCKKADGPTGSGKVDITFNPTGKVASVALKPGPFVGTPVGSCVMAKFRTAVVPAFSGGPFPVTKSFTIN